MKWVPIILLIVAGCATPYAVHYPVAPGDRYFVPVTWYGDDFQGKKTASGALFDAGALTCAAHGFPFGTCLSVTNPETGDSVKVVVTDRPGAAVIDVTKAAFERIADIKKGRLYARVTVVSSCNGNKSLPDKKDRQQQYRYTVELVCYDSLEEAGTRLDALSSIPGGYIFAPKYGEQRFCVRFSSFVSQKDARAFITSRLPGQGARVVTVPR